MSFQTALSGLNAASGNLNVTGHNIANASTTGFKFSRAEFADVYAVSFGGVARTATGSGVRMANVAQQFSQGNVEFTDNNLDLAMSGEGFFMLTDNGSQVFSRAGSFSLDREGYVVNAHGHRLQAYDVDPNTGSVTNFSPHDMRFNLGANPARATSEIEINLNLDADATVTTAKPIDIDDPDSYNFSTTTTVYDSLGATHDATLYFQKAPATSEIRMSGTLQTGGPNYNHPGNPLTVYDSHGNSHSINVAFQNTGGDIWDVVITGDIVHTESGVDMSAGGSFTIANVDFDGAGGALPADMTFDLSGIIPGMASSTAIEEQLNDGPPGYWNVKMAIDDQEYDMETIRFSSDGRLATSPAWLHFTNAAIDSADSGIPGPVSGIAPGNNAAIMNISVNFTGTTQFGAESAVNNLIQDGYTTGRLSGVSVDASGVVFARYTNGQSEVIGAVAVARFNNPNGLQQTGDTNWAEAFESGSAQLGQAGTGTFGQIQSGALEASNVDISKQLVNMIIAQRDFQANAKMITTEDTVTQTIINMR
ncbi:MAG: flagellar hook protein FlgE [Gammaproteobacteria bacterium]|nr:flagellar hook protein FlgE [Gammaproteobacteria bacterium]